MRIRDFGVEIWMNRHETRCDLNLAETCVASLSVGELLDLCGRSNSVLDDLLPLRLTYGAIEGSERLRSAIAGLYSGQSQEDVLVTHGAIGANALVWQTLVEPGDVVVSVLPTYQQHYSIPESLGAEVRPLWLRADDGFLPDIDRLSELARGARIIALTNPNNPTGALIEMPMLEEIVAIARREQAWLFCDEVYRGIDQTGDGFTVSVADLYERGISTGSMSKVWSLAGLRLGWIAAPPELLRAVSVHRDYNTISVGVVDDALATMALENRHALLERSASIARGNLALLAQWVDAQRLVTWVKPRSGTTALLKYPGNMRSEAFCEALLEETGVLLVPGAAMDMEGYVRIGYANARPVLEEGLGRMTDFMKGLAT